MLARLGNLLERQGRFQGDGVNHEGQSFTGLLTLEPILANKWVALTLRARGRDGTVYHDERCVIGPTLTEGLALWVGIGRTEERGSFREEIAMDLHAGDDVGYRYFWGLPGGDFKERSGVRMGRC